MRGVRAAIALLTKVPMGTLEEFPLHTVAWFWIPGVLAGIIWYVAFSLFGSTGVGMIAAVAGEAVLTGGLHWRGLAKIFEGWTASKGNRIAERRQAGLGAAGVLFMVFAALALWTLWQHGGALIPVVWMMPPLWGRALMAWAATWRRVDPSSASYAKFADATRHGSGAWIPLVVTIVLGILALGFEGVTVFGATLVLVGLFLWWGARVFRGMNQELFFASALLTEIVSLYLMVAMTPRFI